LGLSRTFQHVRLMGQMSVLENVAIGAHRRENPGLVVGVLSGAWRLDRKQEQRLLAEAARQVERVGLADHMYDPPAACRWASSACWKWRVRSPPIPACCCSMSRRPACATWKSARSPTCCASCAAKACRSCWSSTTWTS
jgi:hypothetical protein